MPARSARTVRPTLLLGVALPPAPGRFRRGAALGTAPRASRAAAPDGPADRRPRRLARAPLRDAAPHDAHPRRRHVDRRLRGVPRRPARPARGAAAPLRRPPRRLRLHGRGRARPRPHRHHRLLRRERPAVLRLAERAGSAREGARRSRREVLAEDDRPLDRRRPRRHAQPHPRRLPGHRRRHRPGGGEAHRPRRAAHRGVPRTRAFPRRCRTTRCSSNGPSTSPAAPSRTR